MSMLYETLDLHYRGLPPLAWLPPGAGSMIGCTRYRAGGVERSAQIVRRGGRHALLRRTRPSGGESTCEEVGPASWALLSRLASDWVGEDAVWIVTWFVHEAQPAELAGSWALRYSSSMPCEVLAREIATLAAASDDPAPLLDLALRVAGGSILPADVLDEARRVLS